MKIEIIKTEDDNINVKSEGNPTLGESLGLLINGIMVYMEAAIKKITEDHPDQEQKHRSEIHDLATLMFSSAMYAFDPASKEYKTAADEDL